MTEEFSEPHCLHCIVRLSNGGGNVVWRASLRGHYPLPRKPEWGLGLINLSMTDLLKRMLKKTDRHETKVTYYQISRCHLIGVFVCLVTGKQERKDVGGLGYLIMAERTT